MEMSLSPQLDIFLEIRGHGYVLTPGRYVGAAAKEDDVPFETRMPELSAQLGEQFQESAKLEVAIRERGG